MSPSTWPSGAPRIPGPTRAATRLRRSTGGLGVVLLTVDLPAQAVLVVTDLAVLGAGDHSVRFRARDLVVDARFAALEPGGLSRGQLAALDTFGDAGLLTHLPPHR